MVRLLATVVLGALALVVLVPRLLPGAIMSFRIARTRRDRRGRDYDLSAAAGLHAAMPIADRANALDDRTWEDLNLDEVLRALDHTESEPGANTCIVCYAIRTTAASRSNDSSAQSIE